MIVLTANENLILLDDLRESIGKIQEGDKEDELFKKVNLKVEI